MVEQWNRDGETLEYRMGISGSSEGGTVEQSRWKSGAEMVEQ